VCSNTLPPFNSNPMRYEQNGDLVKTASTFHEYVQLSKQFRNPTEQSSYSKTTCGIKEKVLRDFFGDALSYEEMVERCYDGYNAKAIGEQRRKIAELFQTDRPMDEMRVSGEALDVPTYLSGDPKCFWESTTEVRKARVHLCYASNCTAGVNADKFLNHGGAMAVLCDLIADQADTKISCYVSNRGVFAGRGCSVITIKDYAEDVDIPRIGATTHPSFFRRIGFGWFEGFGLSVGKASWTGYGCSETGKSRVSVISDEEFAEWVRIDKDEIVVDLPAANIAAFTNEHTTATWLENAIKTITEGLRNGQKHFTLWD
jgi:hypothetical protein